MKLNPFITTAVGGAIGAGTTAGLLGAAATSASVAGLSGGAVTVVALTAVGGGLVGGVALVAALPLAGALAGAGVGAWLAKRKETPAPGVPENDR